MWEIEGYAVSLPRVCRALQVAEITKVVVFHLSSCVLQYTYSVTIDCENKPSLSCDESPPRRCGSAGQRGLLYRTGPPSLKRPQSTEVDGTSCRAPSQQQPQQQPTKDILTRLQSGVISFLSQCGHR